MHSLSPQGVLHHWELFQKNLLLKHLHKNREEKNPQPTSNFILYTKKNGDTGRRINPVWHFWYIIFQIYFGSFPLAVTCGLQTTAELNIVPH